MSIFGWLLLAGFVVGLIWAVVAQIKQRKKEDFDQRDN